MSDTVFGIFVVIAGLLIGGLWIIRVRRIQQEYTERRRERLERCAEREERRHHSLEYYTDPPYDGYSEIPY